MSKLNSIGLIWQMESGKSLELQVKEALDAWNRRKETKDFVPEYLVFHTDKESRVTEKRIQDLDVKFREQVQANTFWIEGTAE